MYVLILIVVDDGLVHLSKYLTDEEKTVLILIVVDDGLVRQRAPRICYASVGVLILIVVDDGLVHPDGEALNWCDKGLNPYCSGRWSRTAKHFNDNAKEYKLS